MPRLKRMKTPKTAKRFQGPHPKGKQPKRPTIKLGGTAPAAPSRKIRLVKPWKPNPSAASYLGHSGAASAPGMRHSRKGILSRPPRRSKADWAAHKVNERARKEAHFRRKTKPYKIAGGGVLAGGLVIRHQQKKGQRRRAISHDVGYDYY